ncbi:MAG TPA: 4a-hydroxytetrahydrobiopterin dehydratase [Pseudonocardiaceae bacterium]
MSELLSDEQVASALAGLDGWSREGDEIVRTTERASFPAAVEDVRRVAEVAEARDHHPDIDIRWRTLTFRLSTHSAGGLTAKDTELAAEINRLLAP